MKGIHFLLHAKKSFFLVSIIGILIAACSPKITYKWQGKNYENPEQAFAEQKADLERLLNEITQTKNPVGGTAVVILPSIEYLKSQLVTFTGNPSEETKAKLSSFVSAGLMYSLRGRAEDIVKRKIFDSVDIRESGDPENSEFQEKYAILFFKKAGKAEWFLKNKEAPTTLKVIETPPTGLPPLQREIMWLNSLEKEAK